MQATVQTTRFGFNRIKLALVAAGVLSITIVGAVVLTWIDGGETAVQAQTSTTLTMQPSQHRYFEIGQPATMRNERAGTAYLEANGLPVAPIVVGVQVTGTEYLEANRLPVAPVVSQAQSTGTEYLEANGLPIYVEQH
jgi:hypothetical protein